MSDHPHRVALRKDQLVRHVRTSHPYGAVDEDDVNIRRWSKDELKAVHWHLHHGTPPRLGDDL